jgi:hypothetical protein
VPRDATEWADSPGGECTSGHALLGQWGSLDRSVSHSDPPATRGCAQRRCHRDQGSLVAWYCRQAEDRRAAPRRERPTAFCMDSRRLRSHRLSIDRDHLPDCRVLAGHRKGRECESHVRQRDPRAGLMEVRPVEFFPGARVSRGDDRRGSGGRAGVGGGAAGRGDRTWLGNSRANLASGRSRTRAASRQPLLLRFVGGRRSSGSGLAWPRRLPIRV